MAAESPPSLLLLHHPAVFVRKGPACCRDNTLGTRLGDKHGACLQAIASTLATALSTVSGTSGTSNVGQQSGATQTGTSDTTGGIDLSSLFG